MACSDDGEVVADTEARCVIFLPFKPLARGTFR